MYDLIKDFASPVVTLITAFIAAGITIAFAFTQANIARSQRDIALDKLKFDLFEKRYAIYAATKQLLEHVVLIHDLDKSEPTKIRSLYIALDESRFYFPPEICRLLSDIQSVCERFFTHLGERGHISIDDAEKWGAMAKTLADAQSEIRAFYATLPQRFETSLAFKQLTMT